MLWQWMQLVFLRYKGLCQCICGCVFASYSDLGLGVQMSPKPCNKASFVPRCLQAPFTTSHGGGPPLWGWDWLLL